MWFWNKKEKERRPSPDKEKPLGEQNKDDKVMTAGQILAAINQIQKELDRLKLAMAGGADESAEKIMEQALDEIRERGVNIQKSETEKVIEGVFDGHAMIGADGEHYDVPANYASKSKLVEGDILKLTINNLGAFVYKQIKPIERRRLIGVLDQDQQNLQYYAATDNRKWKLLTASVTYFRGEPGDEVVFLIPAEGGSRSAAVENIIKREDRD